MILERGFQERAVGILVDRCRSGQIVVLEVGIVRDQVAAVEIEGIGKLAVIPRHARQQHAARIEMVRPCVPDREQRRHRLDVRMTRGGQEIGRRARIGNPGRADVAVAPGLLRDPVDRVVMVEALRRRAEPVPAAEAGAGTPHVDAHQGVTVLDEVIAVKGDGRARVDTVTVPVPKRKTAVIGREDADRRIGLVLVLGARKVDIDREAHAVAHRHVDGTQPLAFVPFTKAARIVSRRDVPARLRFVVKHFRSPRLEPFVLGGACGKARDDGTLMQES